MNQVGKKQLRMGIIKNVLVMLLITVGPIFSVLLPYLFSGLNFLLGLYIMAAGVLLGFYFIIKRTVVYKVYKRLSALAILSMFCWISAAVLIFLLLVDPSIYGSDFKLLSYSIWTVFFFIITGTILISIELFRSLRRDPLSKREFDALYGRVPRLTVEVVIRTKEGIVMTRIPHGVAKGQWNVPGGTVRFKEPLIEAVKRVAKGELGLDVSVGNLIGYIEYPHLYELGYRGWPVGLAFECTLVGGKLTVNDNGEEVRCFTAVPEDTIYEQALFLTSYLSKQKF